jgi:hypothetical protein
MAAINIFVVCTPPLYDMHHVERLYLQLRRFYSKPFQLICYFDPSLTPHDNKNIKFVPIPEKTFVCERQWNKIDFFNPVFHKDVNAPIIVMDLDWTILSSIDALIDAPITELDFYGVYLWWKPSHFIHNLNGGMYKFFPSTTSSTYETFINNPEYWQSKYLGNHPPPKGEQNFVYHHITKTHRLKYFDAKRIGRYVNVPTQEPNTITFEDFCDQRYYELYNEPYKINGQYNSNICMIHGII